MSIRVGALKTSFRLTLLALGAICCLSVLAIDPIYTGFFSNRAIQSHDTVAYFTEGRPVKGKKKYTRKYKNADWLFSSEENMNMFVANPEKYAPQYGGYCAYAVAQGSAASIEPDQFTVYKGKLYLHCSQLINERWAANKDWFIAEADKHWPNLLSE